MKHSSPMSTAPEVAKAPAQIEYQPLPETAVGGGLKPAEAAQPAAPAEPAAAPAQASNAGPGFDKVHNVIQERCTVCHSAKPTSPLFSAAPAGVMLDTPEQIRNGTVADQLGNPKRECEAREHVPLADALHPGVRRS